MRDCGKNKPSLCWGGSVQFMACVRVCFPHLSHSSSHLKQMQPVYTQGNIMSGGGMSLSQLGYARPVPGYSNYRTPLEGLYMAGAGTHPGGGALGLLCVVWDGVQFYSWLQLQLIRRPPPPGCHCLPPSEHTVRRKCDPAVRLPPRGHYTRLCLPWLQRCWKVRPRVWCLHVSRAPAVGFH